MLLDSFSDFLNWFWYFFYSSGVFSIVLPFFAGPSGVKILLSGKNHEKELQIVKSQNNHILRFAIVSRDFHLKIKTDLVFDSDLAPLVSTFSCFWIGQWFESQSSVKISDTIFTFHYAHLYYFKDKDDTVDGNALEFPKEDKPDYPDFAYFAFVIGMTFQVSDVEINSRIIRRTALAHGLLAFALNTFVVALTINLIAGLKN